MLHLNTPIARTCFRRLVTSFATRRPRFFISRAVYQRFVVDKMTFDRFCSDFFGFPLPLSIYQSSVLTDLSITDTIFRNN